MKRRNFLTLAGAAGLMSLLPNGVGAAIDLRRGQPLRLPPRINAGQRNLAALIADFGDYDLGSGPRPGGMLINQQWPSPTLAFSRGEVLDLMLHNQFDEPTIIHWHGLTPPADMDGHPIDAIDPGASRPYQFTVDNRPATYWYHPHPHHRTARQVYYGMAGFLLVEDGRDEQRGLPTGRRDIPLLLADRRVTANGELAAYQPTTPDLMVGFLGDTVLVNGQVSPKLSTEPAVIRLRLLNGSTARILNPAFADGRSFWLIGTDAGLLDAPIEVNSVLLSPGERIEILVDLAEAGGNVVELISAAFEIAAPAPPMLTQPPQGARFSMMVIDVDQPLGSPAGTIPDSFEPMPGIGTEGAPIREFELTQMMADHFINGLTYDLNRVDFEVPFDRVEIWRFVNRSSQPHPMHMHGTQFRVIERSGATAPTDAGWKDTVLVNAGETVDIALRFQVPGLFVLHCHNLEHEDHGMMLNFEVAQQIPEGVLFADRFEEV